MFTWEIVGGQAQDQPLHISSFPEITDSFGDKKTALLVSQAEGDRLRRFVCHHIKMPVIIRVSSPSPFKNG